MRRRVVPCSLVIVLVLTGCASGISREELLLSMQERRRLVIVDVRSQSEYERDHVPGALPVPFTRISSGLQDRIIAKDEQIVLYCEHGPRTVLAFWSLYLAGYRNVSSLEGHMKGWRENRYPLETIAHRP